MLEVATRSVVAFEVKLDLELLAQVMKEAQSAGKLEGMSDRGIDPTAKPSIMAERMAHYLPSSLWFGFKNLRSTIWGFACEAKGEAWVATDRDLNNPYPVQSLGMRLQMSSPIGDQVDVQNRSGEAGVATRAYYAGTWPVFKQPDCAVSASMSHPGYKALTISHSW